MSWGEAHRLMIILLTDPSSQVGALARGWTHPMSRDDMVLRDIFDLQHRSKAKRAPDPYPRPWHKRPKTIGGTGVSIEQFEAMKRAAAELN